MSERIITSEVTQKIGEEVLLSGWVERIRTHGKIAFIDLKDRGGVLQVVALTPENVSFS